MKRCPVPFLQSDCFTTMLRLSLSALSLDHREAHESATVFLQNLLRAAHENSVSLNFFSEEKTSDLPKPPLPFLFRRMLTAVVN